MQKMWSVLFGVVMFAAAALFIVAPVMGWWLPKNVASYGGGVDGLFYMILGITGFFFILTESLLVYFMWEYAGKTPGTEHPVGHHYSEKKVFWTSFFKRIARPVTAVIHNQHRLEIFWSLVPAVILLFIAIAQISVWAEIKYPASMEGADQIMEVSARQFEWRLRYPKDTSVLAKTRKDAEGWAQNPQADDLHVVNEVHVWKGAKVRVYLKTRDVIHSFYFPNLRLKQDALPGKTIPVWFQCKEYNTIYDDKTKQWVDRYDPEHDKRDQPEYRWELACAELCGWGHYKMIGRLFVHKDEADYRKWLEAAAAEQDRTQVAEKP